MDDEEFVTISQRRFGSGESSFSDDSWGSWGTIDDNNWEDIDENPFSTPSPSSPEPLKFEEKEVSIPRHPSSASSDPVQSFYFLIHKHTRPSFVTDVLPRAETIDPEMDNLVRGLKDAVLGGQSSSGEEPEIPVNPEEFDIPRDGDYREHGRLLMIKMLSQGMGALHSEKIQRTNEMINEVMLVRWDKAVAIAIWNMSRENPFTIQTAKTRQLDALYRGFRKTWLEICLANQNHMEFAEAVCRQLLTSQHSAKQFSVELLTFYSKMLFLCSHGFWLIKYRTDRDAVGAPLGAHSEHAFMDYEKVPPQLVDYVLTLMNNDNFNANGEVEIPIEVIDCAGACIKKLTQVHESQNSNIHNTNLLEQFTQRILDSSRQRIIRYCLMSAQSLAFDDAKIVTKCPMGIFDPAMGDNAIRFRLQFLLAMNNKEKIPQSTLQSLRTYLMKLDPKCVLDEFDEIVFVESVQKPKNLAKKIGEDPYVLIRLLALYAYLRSPDKGIRHQQGRDHANLESKIVALEWWVFVKNAYDNAKPNYLPQEIKLLLAYEDWFLPLIKDQWESHSDRCTDIILGWFIAGIEKWGAIDRYQEPESHRLLRLINKYKIGPRVSIAFLQYHERGDQIPIFEPMKYRVTVSAFTLLYNYIQENKIFNNEEILMAVVKHMFESFVRVDWYEVPEDRRPKGYTGVYAMGMEILRAAQESTMARVALKSRDETYHSHTRDTFLYLIKQCKNYGIGMLGPRQRDRDSNVMVYKFIDAVWALSNVIDLLLVLIPADAYMRHRLREYDTVAQFCHFINLFTEKTEPVRILSREENAAAAAFLKVPVAAQPYLAGLLESLSNYLKAILEGWERDDYVEPKMLKQRDKVLDLAAEAHVASSLLFRMERARKGLSPTV
ncbi:hypothetical protein AA313_de0208256 [Arthrobotrys entomopaga]|nr:hypothetical protein AA313_de0208256 [Arthrobotrys entomopaga]